MNQMYDKQKRAILLLAVILVFGGLFSWQQMPKQEDPRFPNRFGSVTVLFPGAEAESMERLIMLPLERELQEIAEIVSISATARNDAAVAVIELDETIYHTTPVWDEVERAVEEAEQEFPDGVTSVDIDWENTDLESVTYAISGSGTWQVLQEAAERMEAEILTLPGVKRVVLTPDFDTQVTVELSQSASAALGLSPRALSEILRGRSRIIPGGTSRVGDREVIIDSNNSFDSVEDIRRLEIPAGDTTVPLGSIATVQLGPEEPIRKLARFNGERTLIVGVVPEAKIDLVDFGTGLRGRMEPLQAELAPLEVTELTFQPDRVSSRLQGLQFSLLEGILIVAAIVVVALGIRVGGVVALSVPAVALSSVLVYNAAGGVLHQITVAALVVSLGLLVDNAIVISERIQWRIERGEDRREAAASAVRELIWPLAAATGTTLAAFIPLLLSKGVSADFTRAIPQVVMLTIALSFIFSVTVVPTLGALLFRREHAVGDRGSRHIANLAAQTIRRPGIVLAGAGLLLLLSMSLLPRIQLQFFPGADRNQIVLELELPAGTHVSATTNAAATLEENLLPDERVRHIATFVGRSTPAFYYNLTGQSNSPNFAQLLVTTRNKADVPAIAERARAVAREELPGISFVARELEQGPPASAPVAIRLYSEEPAALAEGIRAVFAETRSIEGTRDVRHDLDVGGLAYSVEIEEAAALARGSSVQGIAQTLLARTRGLPSGEFRGGRDPASIVVRAPEGEGTPLEELPATLLFSTPPAAEATPLGGVARGELSLRPATIRRENGRRLATLFSELQPGYGYNDVLTELRPRLPELLPDGVTYEIGGAAESSREANSAILEASYLGVAILLFVLLLQFRSFIRLGLILLTVPLAAVGVIPGLVIFGEPFGFTSLLGTISLIGIVVNNAIILIDTIEGKRREMPLEEAIPASVLERMRPILLTVLTTVCGLTPLLFSSSSLWPPFASAMISGLLASTVMTLLVVPAAYYLIYRRRSDGDAAGFARSRSLLAIPFLLLFAAVAPAADAEELSLAEALEGAAGAPAVRGAEAELRAEEFALRAERREAWLPAFSIDGSYLRREEEVTTSFGPLIGDITELPEDEKQLSITVDQPLLDLSAQESDIASQRFAAERERVELQGTRNRASLEALGAYLQVRQVIAELEAAEESRDALEAQLDRVRRSVEAGRLLRSDQLRLEVELRSLEQQISQLGRAREVAAMDLARKTGSTADAEPTTAPINLRAKAVTEWLSSAPRSVRGRSELRALEATIEGLGARRRGIIQSAVPEVRLRLSGVRQFDTALDPEQWIEGELTLSWTPVARGTRHARRQELTARQQSLEARYRDAVEGGSVQLANVRNAIISALERAEVARQNVVQEEQLRDETEELYRAGRRPLSDFVEAQARVQRARVDERIALFDALEAAGRLAYLTGTPVAETLGRWNVGTRTK